MKQHIFLQSTLGIAIGFAVAAFTPQVQAGEPQIEQARSFENSRNPVGPSTAKAVGFKNEDVALRSPGDQDLGEQWMLKYKEKQKPFSLSADIAGYATNNVALTERGTRRDQFMVGQVAASYQPKITENLLAEFTFRQAFFRYNHFDQLDFDSQNAGAGLTYLAPSLWNLTFFGRYNYNRVLDAREEDEIFTNHTLTAGFQKSFVISRAHYLYAGYASQFGFADPIGAQRDEHGAYAGYHVNLTRTFQSDFFYRAAWFNYSKGDRDDLNQTLSGSFQYFFTKWLYAYTSASLIINNSNKNLLDYNSFNGAIGLSANFKF